MRRFFVWICTPPMKCQNEETSRSSLEHLGHIRTVFHLQAGSLYGDLGVHRHWLGIFWLVFWKPCSTQCQSSLRECIDWSFHSLIKDSRTDNHSSQISGRIKLTFLLARQGKREWPEIQIPKSRSVILFEFLVNLIIERHYCAFLIYESPGLL